MRCGRWGKSAGGPLYHILNSVKSPPGSKYRSTFLTSYRNSNETHSDVVISLGISKGGNIHIWSQSIVIYMCQLAEKNVPEGYCQLEYCMNNISGYTISNRLLFNVHIRIRKPNPLNPLTKHKALQQKARKAQHRPYRLINHHISFRTRRFHAIIMVKELNCSWAHSQQNIVYQSCPSIPAASSPPVAAATFCARR
jgi:hypothetical protein